jgi:hypothetical protein
MLDRFIDWVFDTLILVDVQHQELLGEFGVLSLIPFALFLLSYVRLLFLPSRRQNNRRTSN